MTCIYLTEQGCRVRARGGKVEIECLSGEVKTVPEEIVESIMVFGNIQLDVSVIKKCLESDIPVTFLSTRGRYFGKLVNTSFSNVKRLKNQIYLSDSKSDTIFMARATLAAKVHNQQVILSRYMRARPDIDFSEDIKFLKDMEAKIQIALTVTEAMGFEGISAKTYFHALSDLLPKEFQFFGRTKQPPTDPFNSMLSLGYTIVLYEIYAELESRGINPYISYVHQPRSGHPSLASDLLEEWRAPIVDSVALNMVLGHKVTPQDFCRNVSTGACYMTTDCLKKFIVALEKKMETEISYLQYLVKPTSFRKAIFWQVATIADCIDKMSFTTYDPLRIR